MLDFFSYNPISSAYPRAGIVNLYTKNAPVIAAILAGTLKNDMASPTPNPLPIISGTPAATSEAMTGSKRNRVLKHRRSSQEFRLRVCDAD